MVKIYIKTYGCALNQADSEAIEGVLLKAGFKIVESEEKADLIIINSCAVKQPSEEKFFSYLESVRDKMVVVAGCVPKISPERLAGVSMIGPKQIQNIVEVVEETINGNIVSLIADDDIDRLSLPKKRKSPMIEIVPISSGCFGSCSYCIVKKARGDLVSYKPEKIAESVQRAVTHGAKEIWLTAQDTGCYGADIGTDLPSLLNQLVKIPGNFRIRVGMMNPNHLKKILPDLLSSFRDEKIFKFIHIPVQSGNDRVLKLMRRRYSSKDYVSIIKDIKHEIPDMTVATDIIVGFPTESDEEFNDTLRLIKETKPDVLNISRYWKRKGTDAAEMEQVSFVEIKERIKIISSVFDWIAYENNKKWVKWTGEVLVDEHSKDNTSVGRNYAYKPVIISGRKNIGEWVKIVVSDVTRYDLRAE